MTSKHTPSSNAGWMLLRADKLRLLLPIEDVGAVEHLAEQPVPTTQPGVFAMPDEGLDQTPRYAAALSPKLQPLPEVPGSRFVVTPFPSQPGIVLAWDEVRVLSAEAVALQELPPAMRAPTSPLTHFAQVGGQVAFACTADSVLQYAFPMTA